MQVVLISTYELGRQSFSLASAAAWLRDAGLLVRCIDLSVEPLRNSDLREAELVAVSLPMHTAARLAVPVVQRIREMRPTAHLCAFGLYALLNEAYLRSIGINTVLGGEFEAGLVALATRLSENKPPSATAIAELSAHYLDRLRFKTPDRSGLPDLGHYTKLETGNSQAKTTGYTEATRGCKHSCRHCPIVPVYGGAFRVIQREVVLADIRNQVSAGAEHITFGDPDFFNGPTHSTAILREVHHEFPLLTYDVTIKIEHLLRHQKLLPLLRDTGCLFVTSAVESLDDYTLAQFDKRHTKAAFLEVVRLFRKCGLFLNLTFIPFTPWTTLQQYGELLDTLVEQELVDQVAPVQLSIRLLVTHGSRLLELGDLKRHLTGKFDQARLVYPWAHPDPRMDELQTEVAAIVSDGADRNQGRRETFGRISALVQEHLGDSHRVLGTAMRSYQPSPASIPRLTEPWYC